MLDVDLTQTSDSIHNMYTSVLEGSKWQRRERERERERE